MSFQIDGNQYCFQKVPEVEIRKEFYITKDKLSIGAQLLKDKERKEKDVPKNSNSYNFLKRKLYFSILGRSKKKKVTPLIESMTEGVTE